SIPQQSKSLFSMLSEVSVSVHGYIHVCICVHRYMHVCICVHGYMHVCICVHVCACVCTYVCWAAPPEREQQVREGILPEEAPELLRGLEQLCSGARLRELGWGSLEKRRLLKGRP
uniref:Uncharacterized protein n=1 Tax=Strigops habroptila TaxID=2489341 RepID=A0A672TVF3_STRHB